MLNYFKHMTLFNRVRFIVCFCFVIIGIIVVIFGTNQFNALGQEYDNNKGRIASLENEITQLDEVEPDAEEIVEKVLNSCKDAGDEVALYQTNYQKYNAVDDEVDYLQITQSLSDYFDTDSSDFNVEWYNMSNSLHEWTWTFETNYSFSSTSVPVLWTCRLNDTNELLAYATGTYDTISGLFKDMKRHNTYVGSSYISSTGG